MKTIRLTLVAALTLVACSQEISRQEFHERQEELQADVFSGRGGEAVREYRELAARPPDRALRDSAQALVREIEGLFDEAITLRKEVQELTVPEPEDDRRRFFLSGLLRRDPVQRAEAAVQAAEERRSGVWQEIRAELEGETIEAVDNGMRRAEQEKIQLDRWVESARTRLAQLSAEAADRESAEEDLPGREARQPEGMGEQATSASRTTTEREPETVEVRAEAPTTTEPEPEPEPAPAEPTPEEIREAASDAVEGLDPLYDELVVVLEAIEAAHADAERKRQARQRVTMAGVAKRQEMGTLRRDVAAAQMFRVTGAWRQVEGIRARLEREIAEAREILRGLGGGLQRAKTR